MAGADTMTFSDANFEQEVLKSTGPVLVDFWADWCMPCRTLGPTIDKLATEYKGKVKIGKCDTDGNQNTAMQYNIQSIPTIILFNGGQIVKRWLGVTPEREFKATIDSVLK